MRGLEEFQKKVLALAVGRDRGGWKGAKDTGSPGRARTAEATDERCPNARGHAECCHLPCLEALAPEGDRWDRILMV